MYMFIEQKMSCIPYKEKFFRLLNRLGDFAVSWNLNLFINEKLSNLIPRIARKKTEI